MEFHLLPKYRSMDVIEALKIKEIQLGIECGCESVRLVPEDERFQPFYISPETYHRMHPKAGCYWVRHQDGQIGFYHASLIEEHYKVASPLTPELLKNVRAVVAKDMVSDEEVSKLSQMVYDELLAENRGIIGGPDVIHMQYPGRLAEAVIEMVLNKLAAMA